MSEVQKNQDDNVVHTAHNNLILEAKGLARWFTLDISLKIFGHEILGYHYPPKAKGNE